MEMTLHVVDDNLECSFFLYVNNNYNDDDCNNNSHYNKGYEDNDIVEEWEKDLQLF